MARSAVETQAQMMDVEEALGQAQMLVFDAWEARTAKQRISLAKRALKISPLCADAYVLLAEHETPDSDKALDYWRRGVEAGKEALGEAFEELEGEFWGFLETRPYMRARIGLAYALWNRGAHDEAIEHLRAMLILNPNDNQGARYILAAWLVETERDDELAGLLSAYSEDDMAAWSYTTALAAFRREGDNENSRKLLSKALLSNEHVPGYLLGDRPMPKASPPYYSPGNRDEAVCYLTDFQEGWDKTPGALEWLRACIPAKKRLQQSRKAKRSA